LLGLQSLQRLKDGWIFYSTAKNAKIAKKNLRWTSNAPNPLPELYFANAGATIRLAVNIVEVFMSERDGSSFLWFLAGLGIGAVVGVLYAPRSGSETRDALRARADEGREYVRGRAREAREQASDWVDRGREVLNQQKDQFRAAYEAGRQAYQEVATKEGGAQNL